MRRPALCLVVLLTVGGPALPSAAAPTTTPTAPTPPTTETTQTPAPCPDGMSATVWDHALRAWRAARARGLSRKDRIVVIDYTLPSTRRRLWVVDVANGRVLFHELVAHGKRSGDDQARRFSNLPGSLQSSVGVFITADVYRGAHGKSLRLDGVEPGFNDRARERAIVIHGAPYVDEGIARAQGRLGRSFGCPTLDDDVASDVIDAIADGVVVFAWGDDPRWRSASAFLR